MDELARRRGPSYRDHADRHAGHRRQRFSWTGSLTPSLPGRGPIAATRSDQIRPHMLLAS